MPVSAPSVSEAEISRFSSQAHAWWQPEGAFRVLHQLGPARLAYVQKQIARAFPAPSRALRVLDVGCGGGIFSEALARAGFDVTGIDAAAPSIDAARAHAEGAGLEIAYRVASVEDLAAQGETYDIVVAFEILEHVEDAESFLNALGALVPPEGLLVLSSLNRTLHSFLGAVVAGEYLLGWIPPGTHDWRKFVKPSELAAKLERIGLGVRDVTGIAFDWGAQNFVLRKGPEVMDYFLSAIRPPKG